MRENNFPHGMIQREERTSVQNRKSESGPRKDWVSLNNNSFYKQQQLTENGTFKKKKENQKAQRGGRYARSLLIKNNQRNMLWTPKQSKIEQMKRMKKLKRWKIQIYYSLDELLPGQKSFCHHLFSCSNFFFFRLHVSRKEETVGERMRTKPWDLQLHRSRVHSMQHTYTHTHTNIHTRTRTQTHSAQGSYTPILSSSAVSCRLNQENGTKYCSLET